jgi:hypothetical protein
MPTEPMGWRPYYGEIRKEGTAGGTGRGQEIREAAFPDENAPNPDLYKGDVRPASGTNSRGA